MTTQQAREVFNRAVQAAQASGDHDAVANIEICREYFTNPEFRKALADHLWNTRDGR